MKQTYASKRDHGWSDDPTAWFVSLQRARSEGDEDLEAVALRELARLGVHVAITRHPGQEARS